MILLTVIDHCWFTCLQDKFPVGSVCVILNKKCCLPVFVICFKTFWAHRVGRIQLLNQTFGKVFDISLFHPEMKLFTLPSNQFTETYELISNKVMRLIQKSSDWYGNCRTLAEVVGFSKFIVKIDVIFDCNEDQSVIQNRKLEGKPTRER